MQTEAKVIQRDRDNWLAIFAKMSEEQKLHDDSDALSTSSGDSVVAPAQIDGLATFRNDAVKLKQEYDRLLEEFKLKRAERILEDSKKVRPIFQSL